MVGRNEIELKSLGQAIRTRRAESLDGQRMKRDKDAEHCLLPERPEASASWPVLRAGDEILSQIADIVQMIDEDRIFRNHTLLMTIFDKPIRGSCGTLRALSNNL